MIFYLKGHIDHNYKDQYQYKYRYKYKVRKMQIEKYAIIAQEITTLVPIEINVQNDLINFIVYKYLRLIST